MRAAVTVPLPDRRQAEAEDRATARVGRDRKFTTMTFDDRAVDPYRSPTGARSVPVGSRRDDVGAGHFMFEDNPERFCTAVMKFLVE